MNEGQHASQVVLRFRQQIGEDACQLIGDENLAALELMIESAIDASTLAAIRQAAEIAEHSSKDILRIIERY